MASHNASYLNTTIIWPMPNQTEWFYPPFIIDPSRPQHKDEGLNAGYWVLMAIAAFSLCMVLRMFVPNGMTEGNTKKKKKKKKSNEHHYVLKFTDTNEKEHGMIIQRAPTLITLDEYEYSLSSEEELDESETSVEDVDISLSGLDSKKLKIINEDISLH